jgi:hypothetical protein
MEHKEFEDRLQRLTLFKQKQFREFFLDFIGENKATGMMRFRKDKLKEIGKNELRDEQRKTVLG